jgi:hypothetical protein
LCYKFTKTTLHFSDSLEGLAELKKAVKVMITVYHHRERIKIKTRKRKKIGMAEPERIRQHSQLPFPSGVTQSVLSSPSHDE